MLTAIVFTLLIVDIKSQVRRAMEGYVVHGHYGNIRTFPHSVFIATNCEEYCNMACGGSIINQLVVLSAAHCFEEQYGSTKAFMGHEDIFKMTIARDVKTIKVHKEYDLYTVENDIALVLVDMKIPLGDYTKRIILRPTRPSDKSYLVAGWGAVDEEEKTPSFRLKYTKQILKSKSDCSIVLPIKRGMICAVKPDNNKHEGRPASGDSGSALITLDYQQIGIVSFNLDATPNVMFYTDVCFYYDWIVKHSRQLCCD